MAALASLLSAEDASGRRKPLGRALLFAFVVMAMSDTRYPAPERVFGEVTHVLVPTDYPLRSDTDTWMMKVYGGYLKDHFRLVDKSPTWDLYIRSDRP